MAAARAAGGQAAGKPQERARGRKSSRAINRSRRQLESPSVFKPTAFDDLENRQKRPVYGGNGAIFALGNAISRRKNRFLANFACVA